MIKLKQKQGLGDIQPENLKIKAHPEIGKTPADAKRRAPLDLRHNKHISFIQSKLQCPDESTYPFDSMTMENEVEAGTTETILSLKLNKGVEGILEAYGWYTDADGDANLTFGLYIAGQIVAPVGRYITGSTPLATDTWSPSGESIATLELCPAYVFVEQTQLIEVRCTNPSAVNAYPAWARIRGRHWTIESISSYDRAFFNTKEGRII